MLSGAIEALYLYNSQNHDVVLTHVYRGRPVSAPTLLSLYLGRPAPRASVMYFANTNPATTLFTVRYANLLLCVPATADTEPLLVLEWLHRLVDVLEDFLGAPLLAGKVEQSYDVVAQLITEMCDGGVVATTEPNALRDVVNVPGWVDKLLGGVGLPSTAPGPASNSLKQQLALRAPQHGPAIPWRRAVVKHTSNELYVDIVETLRVTLAPSGRPLAAFAHGSVLFNAKISGVPDLLLTLTVPSGAHAVASVLENPTFHPCVRLARWREHPGDLSFVPPDGKFMLAGYEVNLLPGRELGAEAASTTARSLHLPALVEVATLLGAHGAEFEVRLTLNPLGSNGPGNVGGGGGGGGIGSNNSTSLGPPSRLDRLGSSPSLSGGPSSGRSTPTGLFASFASGGSAGAGSGGPTIRDVEVTVPLPEAVRNVTDLRASRGEPSFSPTEHAVTWRLSAKEASSAGVATLRCAVVGPLGSGGGSNDDGSGDTTAIFDAANGEYVAEEEIAYQAGHLGSSSSAREGTGRQGRRASAKNDEDYNDHDTDDAAGGSSSSRRRKTANAALMPRTALLSFAVQGWLPSGVRVSALNIDPRRSRGLGEGVRPVKGAKYIAISRKGVEARC